MKPLVEWRATIRTLCWLAVCAPISVLLSSSCGAELPEQIVLRHLVSFQHDNKAFTQGLLWDDGFLYESAGQYGESSLRQIDPKTGEVKAQVKLPSQFFAEGLALVGDSLFQLTWRENICLVFDKKTLQFKRQFPYAGEGWGLTYDGKDLILSDGTNTLRFLDPKTFKLKRKVEVLDSIQKRKPEPVCSLNELEWICGEVWANIWTDTRIVRINPKNGNVIGWVEMATFVPPEHSNDKQNCVLNGIALDPATNHIYITGKYWRVMHQFKLEIPDTPSRSRNP